MNEHEALKALNNHAVVPSSATMAVIDSCKSLVTISISYAARPERYCAPYTEIWSITPDYRPNYPRFDFVKL